MKQKNLASQAYRRGFLPPKYMFITNAWYDERWWEKGHHSEGHKCTGKDLAAVAVDNLAIILSEFPDDPDAIAEPNIVSYFSGVSRHH